MGCLLELLFEAFLDGMVELIGRGYIKLMQLIVPNKAVSGKAKKIIKRIVAVFSVLLVFVLIVGITLFLEEDPGIKAIGRYMTYIPLAIMALQIGLGILMRALGRSKK